MLLALWAAPRCRSTAFLRMMVERGDFLVVHEPFSHVADFGEALVDDCTVRSEAAALAALRKLSRKQPVFFKDTTDFPYVRVLSDRAFLREATHTFMIRDPRAAIASHHRLDPRVDRESIGFARLHELFTIVGQTCQVEPVVLDADDLVATPYATVSEYCRRVQIPFLPHALTWSPLQLAAWRRAERWHTSVIQSTGFHRSATADLATVDRDPTLRAYLEYHLPFYEEMYAARIDGTNPHFRTRRRP